MPANMMSAPVGSSFTVSGSSIATVSAGPTPGSTPTKVPSVTPMKPHSRFIGCSATPKPAIRALSASKLDAGAAEDRLEPASRQVHIEELHEEKEDAKRKHQADGDVARPARAAEPARDAREEDGAGDDEAGPADEHHVNEEAGAHPQEWARLERRLRFRPLAPAARESFDREPQAEQDEPRGHHGRNEVRADAGVAALGGQRRRDRGDADPQRYDAERERNLGYFLRPSDSMMPAMRCSSSFRNLAYASPPRNQRFQPSFCSVSFHAGVWVACCTSFTRLSRCCALRPGPANTPRQLPSSTFTFCSLSDGIPSSFFGADCASARILPALMCSANSPSPDTPAVT